MSLDRENEMRMEKELILLRKQNEKPNNKIKPKLKVIKKHKSKVKINFNPKVIKTKPEEIKVASGKVADKPAKVAKAKVADKPAKVVDKPPPMKINTKYEEKVILQAEKHSKTTTLNEIKEMFEEKNNDEELYEEAKKEMFEEKPCYLAPDDKINEFRNERVDTDLNIQDSVKVIGLVDIIKHPHFL